jgi:hypothetical protein
MIKKTRQIDDKVSNQRKRGKGFNQDRFSEEVFDMGSAGQDIFAIDSHTTRTAYGSPTGITERQCSILFILYVQQSLEEIHPFSDLHPKVFDPLLRIPLLVKTFDSQE